MSFQQTTVIVFTFYTCTEETEFHSYIKYILTPTIPTHKLRFIGWLGFIGCQHIKSCLYIYEMYDF